VAFSHFHSSKREGFRKHAHHGGYTRDQQVLAELMSHHMLTQRLVATLVDSSETIHLIGKPLESIMIALPEPPCASPDASTASAQYYAA